VIHASSLGSLSSIPHIAVTDMEATAASTDPPMRGGDSDPSELQLEIMRAHRNWALMYAPHLLEEWND